MDSYQFFKLTAEVRKLQKEYFKTKDKSVLAQSKMKEHELDAEIERVSKIPEENIKQIIERRKAVMKLFDELNLKPKQ